jgi:hypothetical protein
MGGPERVERQHKGGRLTVRERIARMLGLGTFKEIGSIAGKATYDDKGNITGQLRLRARDGGRAAGGDRGRRFHPARRIGGRVDQGQAQDVGAACHRIPHPYHKADRGIGRRRFRQDDRNRAV